ncbi:MULTISPECIES: GGDEF domain-containing protein [unclassified Halomonas]|uniref:GGDEF domain-containing protein n=1 Tax=unclassified Halomonas TaxID=2609666 RepID=UPI0021E460E6|nr:MULTISPECIES: GGDEF domain-containing protein [unclassified Halomonas]UYG00668.1 GGDEF domain-containing protein [Halomonas sp. GD1P12]WNL38276.1 GGDEF domain-containing protein [Halomonas sp. PAMB 3232]WNL41576.1 GGDEF domain-containing protein [Halomonas sp. PAMB 3264]
MLSNLQKIWSPGVADNPVRLRRQIELCNQLGLFAFFMCTCYQTFFILSDFDLYSTYFTINMLFMGGYASILWINHRRWYMTACLVFTALVMVQLFISAFYLSVDAGVPLFYITLAGTLSFLFPRKQWYLSMSLTLLSVALFVAANVLFPSGTAYTPVPLPWANLLHGFSVVGVLLVLGTLLFHYRHQFEITESELLINNHALETLSNTDPLTGLANRRVLDDTLRREWLRLTRHPGALSVIMCDVDHFKHYNDRFGHDGGDRCLQRVALVLQAELSRPADLIVRYGGEEFALVLPETDERGARHVAHRLCEAVRRLEIPNPGAGDGFVTVSVGVSSIHALNCNGLNAEEGESLLKCADQALYQAKSLGRDRAVFLTYAAG